MLENIACLMVTSKTATTVSGSNCSCRFWAFALMRWDSLLQVALDLFSKKAWTSGRGLPCLKVCMEKFDKRVWTCLESSINIDISMYQPHTLSWCWCLLQIQLLCLFQNHLQLKEMIRQMLLSFILLRNVLELVLLKKQKEFYNGITKHVLICSKVGFFIIQHLVSSHDIVSIDFTVFLLAASFSSTTIFSTSLDLPDLLEDYGPFVL